MSEKHIGEVVQVIGPVLDIRFAHDELPALLNAIEMRIKRRKAGSRGSAADWRRCRKMYCHELYRRSCPGHESSGYRRPDHSSGRRCMPGTSI